MYLGIIEALNVKTDKLESLGFFENKIKNNFVLLQSTVTKNGTRAVSNINV